MMKLMYAALTITVLSSILTVAAYADAEEGNSPEPVVTSEGEEHAAVEKPKTEESHADKERAEAALGAAGGGEEESSEGKAHTPSTEEENGEADPGDTDAPPEQNEPAYNTQAPRAHRLGMKGVNQAKKKRYAHAKARAMVTPSSP